MARFNNVNGVNIQFTKAEETAADIVAKQWKDGAYTRKITDLRKQRNRLLKETDWWAVQDRVMTDNQQIYRQLLRDLPASANPTLDASGELSGVTFPENPE